MNTREDIDWLPIYQASVYQFWQQGSWCTFSLDGEDDTFRLNSEESVTLITAWNPGSNPVSEADNHTANALLLQALVTGGHSWAPACGFSKPDSAESWREDGFAVFGWSASAACEWGRKYGQKAVVFVDQGQFSLLFCATEQANRCFPQAFELD